MENKDFEIKSGILKKYNGNAFHVVIPNSVTRIGDRAFTGCKNLTSINIPNSVTSIGEGAFYGCTGLTNIEIPNSVIEIECGAFEGCTSLASINIPNSIMRICAWTFNNCTNLNSINIPNSVTSIGNYAFSRVKNVIYSGTATGSPWGALNVNGEVFEGFIYADAAHTQLTAFIGTIGEVIIPNSVTSIGDDAFSGCTGLTSIEIPNSVMQIDALAFKNCTSLKSIKITDSVTRIGRDAFQGINKVKPQYNSNGSLRAFKGFFSDWTCMNGFKYKVGKFFHQDGHIECCINGFHACTNPLSVFNYYFGNLNDLHFAEVELSGEMHKNFDKVAASDIKIVRELTVQELFDIYNNMEKV